MQDHEIIALYFKRDEQAVRETMDKYGKYCHRIAFNILGSAEDAEECLNDTWNSCWRKIPPLRPISLKAFLVKIVRDHAMSKYRFNHAAKRYSGMEVLLSELDECIPDNSDVEQSIESAELSRLISDWLRTRTKEEQILFVRRYYHGEAVKALASELPCTENTMALKLRRLRSSLKKYLEGNGVEL